MESASEDGQRPSCVSPPAPAATDDTAFHEDQVIHTSIQGGTALPTSLSYTPDELHSASRSTTGGAERVAESQEEAVPPRPVPNTTDEYHYPDQRDPPPAAAAPPASAPSLASAPSPDEASLDKVTKFWKNLGKISQWLPQFRTLILSDRKTMLSGQSSALTYDHLLAESSIYKVHEFNVVDCNIWGPVYRNFTRTPLRKEKDRIIIVEDLVPIAIGAMYAAFDIGPEVFALHLTKSRYGPSTYKDPEPTTWNCRTDTENCISLRWFRPARTKPSGLPKMPARGRVEYDKSQSAQWSETEFVGKMRREVHHRLKPCTNILRKERPLQAFSAVAKDEESNEEGRLITIEERVTLYRNRRKESGVALILTDPLPKVKHMRIKRLTESGGGSAQVEIVLPILPVRPRQPPPFTSVDDLLLEDDLDLEEFFGPMTSMKDYLKARIENESFSADSAEGVNPIYLAIFHIASGDFERVLSLLASELDEFASGSAEDTDAQQRHSSWQALIFNYLTDLPLLKEQFRDFVRWCFPNTAPESVQDMLQKLCAQTDILVQSLERSQQALRAEVSIMESKKGIQEAEGVSRLTELAFIFIPLTFASSLFSMQVKELNDNMPTLGAFFGVCALFLSLSYGARLLVRSQKLTDLRRTLLQKVRDDTELSTKDVPTHVFFLWVFKKMLRTDDWPDSPIACMFSIVGVMISVSDYVDARRRDWKGWFRTFLDFFPCGRTIRRQSQEAVAAEEA